MNHNELTFVIIAQNEEARISRAILSCRDLGQVLVIDGGSTDRTVELAQGLGATVIDNPFRYAAQQYNYGLEAVTTPWAFILDADERIGETLAASISAVPSNTSHAAYWTNRLNYFAGKPIRHSGWSPDLNLRLLRVDACRYDDRPVHARVQVDGSDAKLDGQLHHFTYSTITQYISKLNRFTSREVEARAQSQKVLDARSKWRALYLKLPLKGTVRFVYMYFVRVGFLDGRIGFDLARMSAMYEKVVSIKQRYDAHTPEDDEPRMYT